MRRTKREIVADEQIENWIAIGCEPGDCLKTLGVKGRSNWACVWLEVWRRS